MKLPKGHILKSLTILQVSLSEQAQFVFPNLWDIWEHEEQQAKSACADSGPGVTRDSIDHSLSPSPLR